MNIVHAGEALGKLIARCDTVINLAAICNPSEYIKQPVNTINSNFTDAQETINFCVQHDKHLIHFSTCEVYGRTLASYGLPASDKQNYILDEETTPMIMGPVSAQRWCYGCAKQLVERLIYAHGTENNLKFTIVRPYNWIGPRMDYIPGVDGKDDGQPRVLASFMTALMKGEPLVLVNGGEVYRTFCYVEDAVFLFALSTETVPCARTRIRKRCLTPDCFVSQPIYSPRPRHTHVPPLKSYCRNNVHTTYRAHLPRHPNLAY